MIQKGHKYSTTKSPPTCYLLQEATRSHKKPQEAAMSIVKNFVVSFRNDTEAINSIMSSNIKYNIMDIMIAINSCPDFEAAKKEKIPCIQDFIYSDMRIIDYMIMLYGNDLIMQQYQERFGEIVYSPILTVDFATLILDNIIVIREYNQVSLDNAFIDSHNVRQEDPEYRSEYSEYRSEYSEYNEDSEEDEDQSVASPIINEILREISGLSD